MWPCKMESEEVSVLFLRLFLLVYEYGLEQQAPYCTASVAWLHMGMGCLV